MKYNKCLFELNLKNIPPNNVLNNFHLLIVELLYIFPTQYYNYIHTVKAMEPIKFEESGDLLPEDCR